MTELMCRTGKTLMGGVVCTLMVLGSIAPAAAQDACEGYKRIQRLGGPNAFLSESANTLDDLQRLSAANEDDMRWVLEQQGMGHLADPVMNAIASGNVSERNLVRGETFNWMAWRRSGKARVTNDLCVDTDRTYPAWVIPVTLEGTDSRVIYNFTIPKICVNLALSGMQTIPIERVPPPVCRLKVRQDCNTMTLDVDIKGSSSGAEVVMMSSDGSSTTIIPAGSSDVSWSGSRPDGYTTDLTFKVTASNTDHLGQPQTCEETVAVDRCVAPDPACSITVSPNEVKTGEDVTVNVTGHWADDQLAMSLMDAKGNAVSEPVISGPYPTTVSFSKPGAYKLAGTATNEVGDTASCEAMVDVDGRWTVRGFAGPKSVSSDTFNRDTIRADGVNERLKFGMGSGALLGLALEKYITDRVGIAGGLHLGECDATMVVDFDEAWGHAEESLGMLALTIGPNFHLTPNSKADFYIGPFIGLAELDDATFNVLGESFDVNLGSEFMWGGQLGLDVPFGATSPWAFHARAMYMDLSTDATGFDNFSLDIDPTVFAVGLAYDF